MRTTGAVLSVCVLLAGTTAYLLLREPVGAAPDRSAGLPSAAAPLTSAKASATAPDPERGEAPAAANDAAAAPAESQRPTPRPAEGSPRVVATTARRGVGSVASRADLDLATALQTLLSEPENPAALAAAAEAYEALDRWTMAARNWERLAQVAADPFQARLRHAAACMRVQRWSEALPSLRAVLEIDPQNPPARYNLAVTLTALGHLHAAETAWSEVLARDPGAAEALGQRGAVRADLGDWRGAAEDFAALLSREPQADDAALNLAVALEKQGRLSEARACLERLLATHADHVAALRRATELALREWRAEADAGALAAAERWSERLSARLPQDTSAQTLRAEVRAARGGRE